MTVEIRPPRPEEMPAYYRALPFGNGLPSWEPANAAWHGGSEPFPPPKRPATEGEMREWAAADPASTDFHPVAAFVDGRCVGGSATLSFGVSVPGGGTLRMAGVTSTGVIATHRRRGYLRGMMQAMFDAALERGEPLAMLSASEGSIYGAFGFSPATYRVRWEIERHQAALRPAPPDAGRLELVDAAVAREAWPALHAVVRSRRAGELTPLPGHWDKLDDESDGTNGPLRYLLHRGATGAVDGIAHFRLPWSATEADAGTLVVETLEAITSEAYRSLWGLLLDFDLTKRVVAPGRARDEPLLWMLRNPRALRATRQSDNLWARILDVPAVLEGRRYGVDGSLVIAVADDAMCPRNVGTWRLDVRGGVARCARSDEPADAGVTIPALGTLFFGGASAHVLAFAGGIAADDDTVRTIDRMFHVDPEAHNSFGF